MNENSILVLEHLFVRGGDSLVAVASAGHQQLCQDDETVRGKAR